MLILNEAGLIRITGLEELGTLFDKTYCKISFTK